MASKKTTKRNQRAHKRHVASSKRRKATRLASTARRLTQRHEALETKRQEATEAGAWDSAPEPT